MEYLEVCINSLIKFNNNIENSILYPNNLNEYQENLAIELHKTINRFGDEIIRELNERIEDFESFTLEEEAILIVCIGKKLYSDDQSIKSWSNMLDSLKLSFDKEKIRSSLLLF